MDHFNGQSESVHDRTMPTHQSYAGSARRPSPELLSSYYGSEGSEDTSSRSLIEYWRIFRRHKQSIFVLAMAGTLLAILISLSQTPTYRATTAIEVLSLNEDFMNMKQSSPVVTAESSDDTSELLTQVKLLGSASLLERVMTKLNDTEPPSRTSQGTIPSWRALLHVPRESAGSSRERQLDQLVTSLKIRPTPRTRIIEVSAECTDPKLAMQFANTLTEEFIQQNLEARWSTMQKTSTWLSRELESERAKLERSESALQSYARNSGLIFTNENTNVWTEKLQQVQQELSAATADRIAKQSRYELAQSSPIDSLPDVLGDSGLRENQAKITDLRRQIADLSVVYTPDYSKLRRAQAEVAALQAAFERDRADIVTRIKNDYDEASRKEDLLSAAYDTQTREVTGQDEKAIQYNILKRDVDSSRQLYDTMLQQLKQSSIASALHASNVRVVDPAELPTQPVSPNIKVNSAAGLCSGLLIGFTFVFIRAGADRTLQQPGETHLWTNLPELGTIPSTSIGEETRIAGRRNPEIAKKVLQRDRILPLINKENPFIPVVASERPPSLHAEAFRATLTSILFVGENGSRPRVLVVTSASASDGKTTVTSNLGIAVAEIRRNVLIIDADLRSPRMHELFNLSNTQGLGDLLRDEFPSDNVLNSYIQKSEIPGLDVLTGGPATQSAANLLHSPNLARLIARAKKEYDMVLIDTPPMLQMPDARIAGRLADGVVLVARAEETTGDAIVAATQRLCEDRIRVLGTILNRWDPKRSPSGYQKGFYGSYKQRSSIKT